MKKRSIKKKKIEWIIVFLVIGILVVYRVFFWLPLLNEEEALEVGINKYLEFLWIIDGIFNKDENFNYVVNNKELDDSYKIVSCKNGNVNNQCIIDSFEDYFNNLFAHNISSNKVYGNDMSYISINKEDNQYTFANISLCNDYRMGKKHNLKVENITRSKISYRITFLDETIGKFKGRIYEKMFVLVYENRTWKIAEAYYHDTCHMDYNIN